MTHNSLTQCYVTLALMPIVKAGEMKVLFVNEHHGVMTV